ncbi:MAG: hypothetical protein M3Q03_12095 [Chloroflexota bacterium]|nr:hypothetical protein [Chloroflexota bacterium]
MRAGAAEADERERRILFVGARAAAVAGVVVGGVVVGSQLLIGAVYSGGQARQLVVAMSNPVGTLATAILSGLAAILALMLTMLSLSRKLDQDLSAAFYARVERIALLSILDMVAAIVLMLLLSSPIQEASREVEQAGELQVRLTYYLLVVLTALVSGLFVAVIVMLYNAIQALIRAVAPNRSG